MESAIHARPVRARPDHPPPPRAFRPGSAMPEKAGAPGSRGGPEAQMRHHVLTEMFFELLNSFAQITDLLDHISGAQQYPVNF